MDMPHIDCAALAGRPLRFLSPHPDDAAFAAGGLLDMLVNQHNADLTITVAFTRSAFTPDKPDDLSDARADEVSRIREREDAAYLKTLAAKGKAAMERLGLLDAPLREYGEFDYQSGQPLSPADCELAERIFNHVEPQLEPATVLAAPLSIGSHVDHRIVLTAAVQLRRERGLELLLCEDMPYSTELTAEETAEAARSIADQHALEIAPRIAAHAGLAGAKRAAAQCYPSQVVPAERDAILSRVAEMGGERVWIASRA